MSNVVDPVALARAVASLTTLAQQYARGVLAGDPENATAQHLHVLRLSYDALGVVMGVRTQNEPIEEGCPECDDQVQLILDTCEHQT